MLDNDEGHCYYGLPFVHYLQNNVDWTYNSFIGLSWNKKPSWRCGWPTVLPPPPSHTSTITRYVFETSTRLVDKRSSYLRELFWQPSWQLDTYPDWLYCASVYKLWTVTCALLVPSAKWPVPTAGHAHIALWSRGPLHSSQILNNISDVGFQTT